MKERIFRVLHEVAECEPIYQLESEYRRLTNKSEKDTFLSIIKSIANEGTKKERFACLTIIEMIDKAAESENVIKNNVETINLKEDELLISPLLTLCAALSKDWAITFIQNVMKLFKPNFKEYSYYYDIAIRSIITTPHWRSAIEEINFALTNFDKDYIIDFIAYFKWKKEVLDYKELLNQIDVGLKQKIDKLKLDIDSRYLNHYLAFVKR